MKLSLEKLLQQLVGRGTQLAASTPVRDGRMPTSIRLKPETRHFLEAQAQVLNTSVQSLIDVILDGVVEATTDTPSARLRSIRERFFHLMEVHRLDLPAAVELMAPYGFTLSALNNVDRLLDLMKPDAINHLAETFHVRKAWIRGERDETIRSEGYVRWYKEVPMAAQRLIAHVKAGDKPELMFIRRRGADFEGAFKDNDAGNARIEPVGVVMRMTRETPSGTRYTTYQMWQFERWNYGPCRQQLKLLIAFCEQLRISVVGHELPEDAIKQLVGGTLLPASLLDRLGAISWHPDDYAGFRFEITQERGEWLGLAEQYRKSSLPRIAIEAGAADLPAEPWRPTA
nr:hypothetical protein [uncultured Albidiferax sp.]